MNPIWVSLQVFAENMKMFLSWRTNWNAIEMPALCSLYYGSSLKENGSSSSSRLLLLMMCFKWAPAERRSEVGLKEKDTKRCEIPADC